MRGSGSPTSSRRDAVLFALGLVPFAGIAFLWFVGVLRDRVGDAEDRFFGTVFLGSALLFVALLFVASAVAAGLVAAAGDDADSLVSSDAWDIGRRTTHELMVVYAIRMAAVFTIATSTILMRTRLAPRWLVASGYVDWVRSPVHGRLLRLDRARVPRLGARGELVHPRRRLQASSRGRGERW